MLDLKNHFLKNLFRSMNACHIFEVLLALLTGATLTGGVIRCKGEDKEPWSYNGRRNAPRAWGKTYPECNNRMQSPINIQLADVQKHPYLKHLEFKNYDESVRSAQVLNNGHSARITPNDGVVRTISVNNDTYSLIQLHFHWGSRYNVGAEHLFNSKGYAMEAHFVHGNRHGHYAVVGVLYKESFFNNAGFNAISKELPQIKFKNETTQLRSPLNLTKLLPRLPLRFYRYNGSFTTPPCTEEVIWSVARDVVRIGSKQLEELRSLFLVTRNEDRTGCHLVDNYRPVQPLNGRKVTAST
ncbi:hypothetical protein JTE90_004399 [Oedothorax gibbosus]|uniref:carbonic anhydrase n=1 Tax=Oedothorax gibbosus TaxID=931172 RepID=A0AAV6UN52_9ARAC|nr:hypothetical protein JTE90_004399 [Oedothorax gibbosus]